MMIAISQDVSSHPADRALTLWVELFSQNDFTYTAFNNCEEEVCYFCDMWQVYGERHNNGCIYVKAKQLINELNAS